MSTTRLSAADWYSSTAPQWLQQIRKKASQMLCCYLGNIWPITRLLVSRLICMPNFLLAYKSPPQNYLTPCLLVPTGIWIRTTALVRFTILSVLFIQVCQLASAHSTIFLPIIACQPLPKRILSGQPLLVHSSWLLVFAPPRC